MSLYPLSEEEFKNSELAHQSWYHSFEMLPGVHCRGQYEDDLIFPARRMLRHCEIKNRRCLDIATMEGLIPAIMSRRGAREVVATDVYTHCLPKIDAVKYYHKVAFDFVVTPALLGIRNSLVQMKKTGFDVVNASGLLYHVLSPLHSLFETRALVRTGGIAIISTYLINDDSYTMRFNVEGSFRPETNTFWYISAGLFDYMLRYTKLAPIDCLRVGSGDDWCGYAAVVCRAVDHVLPSSGDQWMARSEKESWEYEWNSRLDPSDSRLVDPVPYTGAYAREFIRPETGTVDLQKAVKFMPSLERLGEIRDTHFLKLNDVN
jgi:2-polyprenyl-3-methyl-5-hydroxy-6-metoxy-1,4-benzoquinol methylase